MNSKFASRKFVTILLYMFCVTVVALSVITKRYDSLIGVGAFAAGLAGGVGTFMWGNSQEHKHAATTAAPPQP